MKYEIHMLDKRKRRAIFHVNMLKKWHQSEVCGQLVMILKKRMTCLHGEERKVNLPLHVGTQLTKQQKGQLWELLSEYKAVMSGKCGRISICPFVSIISELRGKRQYDNGHTIFLRCTERQLNRKLR